MNTNMNSDRITFTADSSNAKPNLSQFMLWLSHRWVRLVDSFTRGQEPRVWQQRNLSGGVFYCAYAPYTGRSVHCSSETELRTWLEQLPYC